MQESKNPTKVRKEVVMKERQRVQKGMDRLVDAYQEGLVSIEELRRRVSELKKRDSSLRSELQALEAGSVDQERSLQLVGTITDFLSRLRQTAETLTVVDRQKIVRLVVKQIFVGADTLTIKHSIPISNPTIASEMPSYLLWGRSLQSKT